MFQALRSCCVIACGLALASASPARTAGATTVVEPTRSIDQQIIDQITRADATRNEGRLADAARIYAEAYRLTTTDDAYRYSEVAVEVVIQAATSYRRAFVASSRDFSLCEESRALLVALRDDWESSGQAVPPVVLEELAWVDQQLAQAPPPTPEPDPTDAIDDGGDDGGNDGDEVEPPQDPIGPDPITGPGDPPPDSTPTRPSKALDFALLGVGAAAAVTGAILVGVGAPVRGRAETYHADTTASDEFTALSPSDQQIAIEYLDAYVDDERRRGVALMATGGAALGVGVAALVVGSIRVARHRDRGPTPEAARLHPRPSLGRREVGLGLWLEF